MTLNFSAVKNVRVWLFKYQMSMETKIPIICENYINRKMWNDITCVLQSFNGVAVEVWEWINNFTSHFTERDYYQY